MNKGTLLRGTIRIPLKKIGMTLKVWHFGFISYGAPASVRVAEESPQRGMDNARRKGEDLERKARAGGNAHIYKKNQKTPNNQQLTITSL